MEFDPETYAITAAMMKSKQIVQVGNSVYIDEDNYLVFEESNS